MGAQGRDAETTEREIHREYKVLRGFEVILILALLQPAALVNNLKTSSREFADATWTVPKDAWGKDGFQEQAGGV